MSARLKSYKHWVIAVAIGIAGFGIAATLQKFVTNRTPIQTSLSQIANSPAIASDTAYASSGPEAKDDNFFLSGTFQNVSDLKDSNKPTVVWISASWCQVCHEMRKFIWKSANKYSDKLVVKEIDFADNYNTIVLPNYYFGTPTFVVLNAKGDTVTTFYGADEQGFDEQLAKASLIQ